MLVMGAYGHARLQKMVLGGVPREMLRTDDGTDADVALT